MPAARLAVTSAVMGAFAVLLGAVTPGISDSLAVLAAAQEVADAEGPDAVVVTAVGLLAWSTWAWGALGLLVTGAAALPGALGAGARMLARAVLPAAARRAMAVALGVGLGVSSPLVAGASPPAPVGASAPAPDWPQAPPEDHRGAPVPDWPDRPHPGQHVVVRGDCLWDIAAHHLGSVTGHPPSNGEIARAVQAWWTTNAGVIGPDPDLLLPGQVLRPPSTP